MNELLRRLLFLPPQASTVAPAIDGLHYFVILTTMVGAALVNVVGGYFLVRYRRPASADGAANPDARRRPPRWLEATAVAGLFGLLLAWWGIGVRQFVRLRVAPADALDVYVTARQWMWTFTYPGGERSQAVLYVPAGRPVRLVMTSRDVIHSFYVPDFRIKHDVLPARTTTAWFEAAAPGRHEILCTEYCGVGHSTMRGQVAVLSARDYARWRARGAAVAAPAEPLELVRLGVQAAAEHGCLKCHSLDGTPHIGPTWAGLFGARVALEGGGSVVADEAYLTESMMDPAAKLSAGYPPTMPGFQGQLRPADVAALLELIRSLRDAPREGTP